MRTDLSLEHFNFKIPLFLLVVHGISNKLIDAVDQLVKILRQPYNIPVSRFCGDMLELSGAVTNLVERALQQGVKGTHNGRSDQNCQSQGRQQRAGYHHHYLKESGIHFTGVGGGYLYYLQA